MRIKRGPTAKSRSPPAQDSRQLQFEPVSFQQGRSGSFFVSTYIKGGVSNDHEKVRPVLGRVRR